jgi:hypothetical protein
MRGLAISLGFVAFAAFQGEARAQNYIGAGQCKSCHEFEYRVWASGPHAKGDGSLSEAQRKDPKCNTCHMMTVEGESAPDLQGIECERCHGPGRYYHRRYVMRDKELSRLVGLTDPKPEHCMQCHTEGGPSIRPFVFAEMWAKIDHGREALSRWRKNRATLTPGGEAEEEP